jgi:hypothetical protein
MLLAVLLQVAAAQAAPDTTKVGPLGPPPRAAAVTGAIAQVTLSPVFDQSFACTEHPFGALPYAGDALGTDCLVIGGINGAAGYPRLYRTDGKTNADWYGWHADVLAPADGVVLGTLQKPDTNTPGTMGRPPAGTIRFLTDDGIVVVYGHATDFTVKPGDRVKAGQRIGRVGNNGMARAPHVHIGAYRASDLVPLQIRWDQRAMARLIPNSVE